MLEVRGLAAGYLGKDVIADLDFGVAAGEAVAIIGSNGAGKSTLFRAVCGLLRPSAGAVRFNGRADHRAVDVHASPGAGCRTSPPSVTCSRR